MGCCYMVQNDLSGAHAGRVYIGQTVGENYPHKRMARHVRDAARGSNFEFHKAIRSEGAGHFYVSRVWQSSSQRCLNIVEKLWAECTNAYCWGIWDGEYPPGYNMALAGQTNKMLGKKHTDASKAKISAARKRYWADKISTSSSDESNLHG